MAEYIAAKTAADGTGADIVVTTAVGISCYGMSGNEMVGKVMTKNSDLTYTDLMSRVNPNQAPVLVTLTGIQKDFTITKPGTYKIVKFATVGTVGIDKEGS